MKIYKLFDCIQRIINRLTKEAYTFMLRNSFCHLGGKLEPLRKLEGAEFITIGKGSVVGRHSILTAWKDRNSDIDPMISIGMNTNINEYNHITSVNKVVIGNNVLTGRYVLISDNSHGQFLKEQLSDNPLDRPLYSKGPIIIGDNVWLGERVCVMGGVTIGEGCIVAANSVVTTDIPPFCMAAGVPAIIKKQLKS